MKVSHDQIIEAYHRWAYTTPDFYTFTGADYKGNYIWYVPDEISHRLQMILSPHWKTLLKAYRIRHGTEQ